MLSLPQAVPSTLNPEPCKQARAAAAQDPFRAAMLDFAQQIEKDLHRTFPGRLPPPACSLCIWHLCGPGVQGLGVRA